MVDASLITLFVRPLNQLRIPYMVTGGVASVVYCEPRFTRDIDLVIALSPRDARRFGSAWPAAEFYVPPVEVIEEESRRPAHGHFNVSHHETAMRADIYLPGDDPLNAWALESVVAAAGEAPVCFYRTAAGAEVDLVIEGRRNRRYAIEINRSSAPTVSKGFWNGRDDVGAREALVIYPGDERIPIGDRAEALGLRDAITWVRDRVHGHG